MLKYFSRAGIYKNSTGTNTVNLATKEAYSYSWWKYCTMYKDQVIFNNATYSPSTNKHQAEARRLLGDNIDLMLNNTSKSLVNTEEALLNEVELLRKNIGRLIDKVKTPRTRASTNNSRREEISQYLKEIAVIRTLLVA